MATDESAEMIAQAPREPKIEYRVAEAENSGIEAHSVDLVTVASAIHWFDLNEFYTEVRCVVKPGGVIAVWTYYTLVFESAIDALIERLAHEILADYWDERLHFVVDEFHDLPFPFEPIDAPQFRTDMRWNMEDLLGYFEAWSSSVKYREATGAHLTDLIKGDVARVWGDPEQERDLHLPLYMRVGRV
jgi:SAM-dependent methyltransferase